MPYKLTPYDRRVRAQLMREQRLGGSYKAMKKREQEAAQAASLAKEQEKEDGNWFTELMHTGGDLSANVITGLGKGLEGIYDLFAGLTGAVGGLFSDEFENDVKAHIATDHIGEWFGNDWQAALDESWLNDSTAGGVIEGVAQGVGQLLPAVIVTYATGGAGAPTLVSSIASLSTTMASAAGTSTEQAFQEGADYGEGMLYGLASGAIEGATEQLSGGLGKLGKVGGKAAKTSARVGKEIAEETAEAAVKRAVKTTAKKVGAEVADVGIRRIAKETIGEGVEEMLTEAANPALKSIYKGKDAWKEYGESDFWAGVGEAGVIGMGTNLAYGGTVGRVVKSTGIYADARNVAEHIEEQRKKIDTGELSPEAEVQAQKNIKRDMELLSGRLQRVSQKTRDNILRGPDMALNFDTDGKIKVEIAEKLDANIKAAGDTSSGLDRRYYSASARGREAQIIEGLAAQGTKVVEGELTKEEGEAYQKAKEIHRKLKSAGFVDTDLVLAETMPDANAYLDGRTVVIGKDTLADGSYVKHLVHETTHFTEGTQEWLDVMDHVFGKDGKAVSHLIERVKASGYGVTDADVTAVLDAVREGKLRDTALTEKQQTLVTEVVAMQMEETFGSEDAINRLVGEKPNLAKRILERIKAFLQTFGKSTNRDPEAVKQLRRTEELFRKALEKAGVGYAHDELTRMNEKNAQVSEENGGQGVDESREVRYNGGEVKKSAKIVKYIPYSAVGQNHIDAIRRQLIRLYEGIESGVADGVAIENGDAILVVDSGKENGSVRFGVRKKITIKNDERRNRYVQRINQESADNGFGDRTVFKRLGADLDHNSGSNVGRELREDKANTSKHSSNNKNGIPDGASNRGVSVSKPQVKKSRKIVPVESHEYRSLVNTFGVTKNYEVAGYLLGNGLMLDFSGKHWGDDYSTSRQVDHRDVLEGLGYDSPHAEGDGVGAMIDMIGSGNIRLMPETGGINLALMPNETQMRVLRGYINHFNGEVIVDVDEVGGDTIHSFEYNRGTASARILSDIEEYFKSGTLPQKQSDLGRFRYSRKATGETVTISKGEMAKLHANYAGDKVFIKKDVAAAIKTIDALQKLPAAMRNELVTRLWRGYNERLNEQGFAMFTEIMWHQMHAEILQESGFEMSEDEITAMDEQIVNALHQIVASGKPSIKAKLESDISTEGYRKQAQFWRDEHGKAVEYHKRLNTLKYELEKLANQKKGLYVNAANFRGDSFKVAIDELAKMNWRGGLVSAGKIRERFAKLAAWYTKENPLYKGDGGTASLFKQEIADALNSLGNSQNGALTAEDLMAAETVVKYFAHEIEAHNTYYKDEKRLDATPKAKEYIEKVRRAGEIAAKCGIWSNLMRSKFARMVADPAMLMRQADGYLSGFFTEQYEALRQGTIDAAVLERELSEEFEQFWEKNKAYAKRYNSATVTFDGKEMPLQEGIQLYMTMYREDVFAGLAGAGFDIEGKHATEEISAGFAEEVNRQLAEDWKALPPEELLTLTKKKNAEMERAALAKVVEKKRQALYDQFTPEDKLLISIMEKGYNVDCRDVKVRIDEIVQGYTNVKEGYYCPVKRTGLAENVDAYTGFEGDRVSNLSMNKDTVKNAHKLLIEPAHIVFMRHLKATSLYHGLGVFTDNFNRLYNLNIGTNANNPITVRTALGESNKFAQEMVEYFKELKQDVEGISKKRSQEKWYNDAVGFIRSSYATYQLGANPKVWVTQLSSYIAAHGLIDADCLVKGLAVSGKDVDEYCRLAWLRNNDSSAAQAQAVGTSQNAVQRASRNVLQKIRDVAMLPIGKVDRLMITRLFGACQVQVEKKGGAKVGTKENKIAAGKLLQRVILETQQNSLATERSAAMRSSDELLKGFTMFSADAMKVGARFVDAFGELSVLKTLRKEAKKAENGAEVERLNKEIKRARKQCVRATVSLVSVALFNAALAYAFKWLYRRDEEESVGTVVADTFGNMLGGIPFVRDLWSFFQDGFEMDHFLISTVNDVLGTAAASFELVGDAMDGKEITKQDVMGTMRKISYAAGQLSGLPVRNVYNFGTGMLNRVSPEAGYEVESLFFKQAYASDLQNAIDAGDDEMVGTIAGLMIDEKIGIEDNAMRKALQELTAKGHSVLPRSVGDSVTVNGETVTLTAAQQKKLRKVYAIGQEAVADMVKLKQFGEADEKVQAAAIKFVYDVYWDLALEDALGLDLAEKNVLFAEAIDIEKLAIIIATARAIEADKDKSGKAIGGSKKRKVQTFVNSLRLSAAEKYMVMGYLGYSNAHGEGAVKAHIGKLNLSKSEKEKLLKYSGY